MPRLQIAPAVLGFFAALSSIAPNARGASASDVPAPAPSADAPITPMATPGPVATPPPPPTGYDEGFYTNAGDGKFSLKIRGLAQGRYTYRKDGSLPDPTNNFTVPLARVAFAGKAFNPSLSYFLQYQSSTLGNTNGVVMLDWWVKYTCSPLFSLKAGRFLLPFSRSTYTNPALTLFGDPAAAEQAFGMNRAIGVHISGAAGKVSYELAGMNSVSADGTVQNSRGKDLAALARLELAILAPYGYLESSPKPIDEMQLSVGLAAAYNPIAQDSATQNTLNKDNAVNMTVDMGFRMDRLSVQAAYFLRKNTRTQAGASNYDTGVYGQAAYFVIPERVEVAGRYAMVDFLDRPGTVLASPGTVRTKAAGDTTEYTGGVNYYLHGHNAKLNANYTLIQVKPFAGASNNIHRVNVQTQLFF